MWQRVTCPRISNVVRGSNSMGILWFLDAGERGKVGDGATEFMGFMAHMKSPSILGEGVEAWKRMAGHCMGFWFYSLRREWERGSLEGGRLEGS